MCKRRRSILALFTALTCTMSTAVYATETRSAPAESTIVSDVIQRNYPIHKIESETWVHEEPYFTDKEVRSKIPIKENGTICYLLPWTLGEAEDNAELIIRAEILPESQNVIIDYEGYKKGFTRNKIKILEVFKGDSQNPDLKNGDEIFINEPYFYTEDENGELCAYTNDNYAPSQVGNEYIFFLTWQDSLRTNEYNYVVSAFQFGRYLVKSDELFISGGGSNDSDSMQLVLTEEAKPGDGESVVTKAVPFTKDALEGVSNEKLNIGNKDKRSGWYSDRYFEVIKKYVNSENSPYIPRNYTIQQEDPEFLTNSGLRKKIPYYETCVQYMGYKNLTELENYAEVIIRAEILPEAQNVSFESRVGQPLGFTKTKARILEVFKGDVKDKDLITLSEPYHYFTDGNGEKVYNVSGNYSPSLVGEEYIFFLISFDPYSLGPPMSYAPIAFQQGRYIVKSEDLEITADAAYRPKDSEATEKRLMIKRNGEPDAVFTPQAVEALKDEELKLRRPDAGYFREIYNDVMQKYI